MHKITAMLNYVLIDAGPNILYNMYHKVLSRSVSDGPARGGLSEVCKLELSCARREGTICKILELNILDCKKRQVQGMR